jgi:hypothetical protein
MREKQDDVGPAINLAPQLRIDRQCLRHIRMKPLGGAPLASPPLSIMKR